MKQNNSTELSGYSLYKTYHKNNQKLAMISPLCFPINFLMIFRGILFRPQRPIDMAILWLTMSIAQSIMINDSSFRAITPLVLHCKMLLTIACASPRKPSALGQRCGSPVQRSATLDVSRPEKTTLGGFRGEEIRVWIGIRTWRNE